MKRPLAARTTEARRLGATDGCTNRDDLAELDMTFFATELTVGARRRPRRPSMRCALSVSINAAHLLGRYDVQDARPAELSSHVTHAMVLVVLTPPHARLDEYERVSFGVVPPEPRVNGLSRAEQSNLGLRASARNLVDQANPRDSVPSGPGHTDRVVHSLGGRGIAASSATKHVHLRL